MTIKGVLFDFSGTLFRIESVRDWLLAALNARGGTVPEAELVRYADLLAAAGALPGGSDPERVPAHLTELWATRDESMERHRAAYTGLARRVELPDEGLYDALYERHMAPAAWRPYPDAAEVLTALRERGLGIAVVSNIGWDLRPVFRAHGLDALVDAYVLSYEHGVQKPDVRLFRTACDALGQDPSEVLMVGDSRSADGGAAHLGCAVHFVDHLPVEERPAGLRPVIGLTGAPAGSPTAGGTLKA
ncbi:HAD-IA family hydrolase [Streptomyces lunaelactis]|uniref:HAD family hydrolase n=1 Tax=Streptomyces lunaelactis TaxID=1535768 RepID=UPI0015852920|nr:HAD-IA family hydrolase [Streptomyces lunaelactis]NUK06748.1 HAD-IA family hydrolase [Streptomyces lunaelactis]NUK17188.1 HAD-IA family hydrolase [Streptomyces lunaelactis]NUL10281.1 HAD-IA family hydrolase [Streptomyces lunaelactis]NUL26135.1 HAD-IA family hydrolase [Streptomyces lunaelactis]